MLRIKIEIIPQGDETRTRTIGRFDIGNVSPPGQETCDYKVEWVTFESTSSTVKETFYVTGHERAKGAYELCRRVLECAAIPETRWDDSETPVLRRLHRAEELGLTIREDGRLEWQCDHGVGHPVGHIHKEHDNDANIHGCDGCCGREEFKAVWEKLHERNR